jgi:DNA-3-methyladenine glycosylase
MSYFARVPEVEPLSRSFFARDVLEVAPALLGCLLVNAGVTLRLTEVEAYAGEKGDPGSHAFRGQTPRTAVMFGPAGHLYVYFTYGMHFCANVVTGEDGLASAVLLRAGAVVDGHELAATRRPGVRERDWARGPARLTVTMGLAREENGLDLCGTARTGPGAGGRMLPPSAPVDPATIRTGPRVGVSGPGGDGTAYPWRFWLDGEPTVSPYRPGVVRSRGQKRA